MGSMVLAVLLLGTVGWLLMSTDDGESADAILTRVTADDDVDTTGTGPAVVEMAPGSGSGSAQIGGGAPKLASVAPSSSGAGGGPEISPSLLQGLRISSQSWRRGGLGSKALVTLTLRNANAYAVKDVAIACAFSRSDGSHVTDRRRVLPGEVARNSRKTFAAVHVGFVNVNASKAKCGLVSASKL